MPIFFYIPAQYLPSGERQASWTSGRIPELLGDGKAASAQSWIYQTWAEIRNSCMEAGPALDFHSLVRKEMDYGAMEDLARETWNQFSWSHVLRAFILWVVLFLLAYGIYLRFFA